MVVASHAVDGCRLYLYDGVGNILYSFDLATTVMRSYDGGQVWIKDLSGTCFVFSSTLLADLSLSVVDIQAMIAGCTQGTN